MRMSLSIPPPFTAAPRRLHTEFLLDAAKSMTRDPGGLSTLKQLACQLRPLFQLRRQPDSCSCSHSVLSFHNYTLTWLRERIFYIHRRTGNRTGEGCLGYVRVVEVVDLSRYPLSSL